MTRWLRIGFSPSAIWVGGLVLCAFGCDTPESPTPEVNPYELVVPTHFPELTYTLENNPITEAGFNLGKTLFYDANLSRDRTVSCNSCHQQAIAFADNPAHPTSVGVDNRRGSRNAPALANLAFYPEFFWDGGVHHLDFVPINAIESPVEMDANLAEVVVQLNASEKYRDLFSEAFGIEEITSPYMLQALSQFTALMVSAKSPYDEYLLGDTEALTAQEVRGLGLFEANCGSCHAGVLQTDFSYRNNGLDAEFADAGRAVITEHPDDEGKFRVPSLRNVELTAPYMHNARFSDLEEVLEHYTSGLVNSATLDETFLSQNGEVQPIALTSVEQQDIIAFLRTLTDRDFISNPIFRN
ncbi:MAG: cytochrome c peroxidase [Bacteroidota bacterium]